MDSAKAIETTPLIAQHDNNLPAADDNDEKKESTVAETSDHDKPDDGDEPSKGVRLHLTIFLTALAMGVLGYTIFALLYPLILRIILFLFSLMFSTKTLDEQDNDFGPHPLSFGMMMFGG